MADVILSALTETTTPTSDALVYVLDDPSGSPADRKVKATNLLRVSGGRELLAANRTYYVRTDGSNTNTGLVDSAGGAFLTIQKAINVVSTTLNLGGYNVTIQVADGTYVGDNLVNSPWDGIGDVTITGNISTPANVIITPSTATGAGMHCKNSGRIIVTNLKLYDAGGTSAYGLRATAHGYIGFSNVVFATYYQIVSESQSFIESLGNYSVAAGTYKYHLYSRDNSTINISHNCSLSGTPAYTIFAYATTEGIIDHSDTFGITGSATGQRYNIGTGGKIYSLAIAETEFPGNAKGVLLEYGGSMYSASTGSGTFLVDSDHGVSSNTTLAAVTGTLSQIVLAGHIYTFKFTGYTTSNASGGVKFSINGTATATSIIYEGRLWSGGTCTQTRGAALNDPVCAVTAVTAAYVEIVGRITVNATGTLRVYFAQNASNAAASTVLSGSTFDLRQLN